MTELHGDLRKKEKIGRAKCKHVDESVECACYVLNPLPLRVGNWHTPRFSIHVTRHNAFLSRKGIAGSWRFDEIGFR